MVIRYQTGQTKGVVQCMENQEVVHKEGSGVLTGTFISCSVSGKTGAYLPSEAVCSPTWYKGTTLFHTSFCRGTGSWSGKHVCFYSDNMAMVVTLNTKTAKFPRLMHLMRCFSFYCAFYRFHVSSRHIEGSSNAAADALSRNNPPLFYALVPQASGFSVPPGIVELLVAHRPNWGSQAWTDLRQEV